MQANTQALLSMGGFAAGDVLLAEWSNASFRPCHYVALDTAARRVVLGVRGSLEIGDIATDLTAAPVEV